MAVLTWQNVDAPDLRTAGALTAGAADSWQQAMAGIGEMFADGRERRVDKSSGKALLGAAGITDPEQLKAYLASVDGSKLNNEAAAALSQRMGDVLGYQSTMLSNESMRNNIDDTAYDSRRDMQYDAQSDAFQNVRLQANEMARNGDKEGAEKLIMDFTEMNPQIGDASLTSLAGLGEQYGGYLNERSTQMVQELTTKFANPTDAIAEIRGMDIPEDLKAKLYSDVSSLDPTIWTATDSNMASLSQIPGLLDAPMPDGNQTVGTQRELNMIDNEIARTAIDTQLDSDEFGQNKRYYDAIGDTQDYRAYLSETLGIEEDGWTTSNLDVEIQRVVDMASSSTNGRVKITPRQAAAAIAQTFDNGVVPLFGRDKRFADVTPAAELAARMYDPASQRDYVRRNQRWQGHADELDRMDQQLAAKEAEILRFQDDNPDRAAAAQSAYVALLAEQRALQSAINVDLGLGAEEEAAASEPGAPVARGTAAGPKVPPPAREPEPTSNGGNPVTPPRPRGPDLVDRSQRNNMPPATGWREDITSRWR